MTVEEAIEIIERKCGVQSDTLSCAAMILVARIKELEAANSHVRDVLETLVDNQNGCPLPSYEEEWSRAMSDAFAILNTPPTPPEVTG